MGERKVLGFVNQEKGAEHYVKRYLNESKYKEWFHRNYPEYTIYEGIGISKEEYEEIASEIGHPIEQQEEQTTTESNEVKEETDGLTKLKELAEKINQERSEDKIPEESKLSNIPKGEELAKTVFDAYPNERGSYDRRTFEEFVDERILVSRDLFGKKEMKIKILEVSDERQDTKIQWKFGDRVKVNKILITVKHLDSMQVEEGEFDIEQIEKELAEKRHYSSTNRWIPATDIKNGYVINSKHTALISDAVALDYIIF